MGESTEECVLCVPLCDDHTYLTRGEVAWIHGVAEITISRWQQDGLLTPYYGSDRILRFKASEVEQLLKPRYRKGNLVSKKEAGNGTRY